MWRKDGLRGYLVKLFHVLIKKHPIHISHCIKFSAFVYGEVGGDNISLRSRQYISS